MNKSRKIVEEIQEKLEKGIQETMNDENFKQWLKVVASFHQYSYNNTILICSQNPEATLVKGYQGWRKLGRYVRKGERAIKVLAPVIGNRRRITHLNEAEKEENILYGFRFVNLFDISQTEGTDLPENPAELLKDSTDEQAVLEKWIQKINIPIMFKDIGSANGFYSREDDLIVLNEKREAAHQMKTLIHEFAHHHLHRCGATFEREEREIKEAQAESVAYVVLHYFGYDTARYSFAYISSWAKDFNIIKKIGQDIVECISTIIDTLERE